MKQIITLTLVLLLSFSGFSQNTIFSTGFEEPIDETGWTTGMSTTIEETPFDYPGDLDPWEMWDNTSQNPYVHSGTSAAFIGGTLVLEDKYDWLVSPEFLVPTDSDTNINYWMWYWSSMPSNWTWFYIMVYDVSEDTWEVGELILHEENAYLYYDQEYSFNLSAWEGKDIKIGFVKRGTYQFALDDISCISVQNGNDLALTEIQTPTNQNGCTLTANEDVKVKIENTGTTDINSFEVKYSINNGPFVTETVTEELIVGESLSYTFTEKADLSAFEDYIIDVEVNVQNDQNASNNSLSTNIKSRDAEILVELRTDAFPGDNSWVIVDENNNIVATNGELEKETFYYDTVCVMSTGCYTFTLLDDNGDGLNSPPGFLNVYYNGNLMGGFNEYQSDFGSEFVVELIGDGCDVAHIDSVSKNIVKAYPNPVTNILYLQNLEGENTIQIFDLLGRKYDTRINSGPNSTKVDFSNLHTGLYLIKITSSNNSTDSFIIQKK